MAAAPSALKCMTWNIAAVNNNPFEYWITHPDAQYNNLMLGVQEFIDEPGDRDVPVSEVFTPTMMAELSELMSGCGWGDGVAATAEAYANDFSSRPIISGFLQNAELGSKRLASMPDRMTNTINCAEGTAYRPTVINLYDTPMDSTEAWWAQWKQFMFESTVTVKGKSSRVFELLSPIKRAKYPAVTEEEERISLPLQTLVLAIFDAVELHILNTVLPGAWGGIKASLCDALSRRKTDRTLEIMAGGYADCDVMFIQEAAAVFVEQASSVLGTDFHVLAPAKLDAKRDQNSLILARKSSFDAASATELTAAALQLLPEDAPVAAGDLFVVSLTSTAGQPFVLASFHGDTNGLATIPVLEAVVGAAAGQGSLLFGLDANAHFKGKEGKKLGVAELRAFAAAQGLESCFGGETALKHTTFNARTYLQPQLNKAVKMQERETSPLTDRHPKDFILFRKMDFSPAGFEIDNSGAHSYDEAAPIPTLTFPSDHAVLSTTVVPTGGVAPPAPPGAAPKSWPEYLARGVPGLLR